MKPTGTDTLSLLKQLKHKRFSSEMNPNQYSEQFFNQPLINPPSSSGGFVCSYHPTEYVTNFCLSQQQELIAKPLCPRCLQQHMKSHQHGSNPSCKLEACDTQVQVISVSLTEKLNSCQSLTDTISHLTKWQSFQLQQIHQFLYQFKSSLFSQLQKQFTQIEKQLQTRWEQHTKDFNQIVKLTQSSICSLQETCQRSLKMIEERKDIDSICMSVPQIGKKFDSLAKMEEQLSICTGNKMEAKWSVGKIGQILNCLKGSLEVKTVKLSGYEVDRILKQIKDQEQKSQSITQSEQNPTLAKLQKLFQAKSSGKLHTIEPQTRTQKPSPFSSYQSTGTTSTPMQPITSTVENSSQRVLSKLNDTTNKLKSSLNGFTKSNNAKVYS